MGGGEWIRREVVAMVHYGRKKVSGGLLRKGRMAETGGNRRGVR